MSGQASELVGQRECLLEVQQAVLQHYFDMQARCVRACMLVAQQHGMVWCCHRGWVDGVCVCVVMLW